MNQEQPPTNRLPIVCWIIIGFALGVIDRFYTIPITVGLYFLLKHLRPKAGYELLTVASVFTGMALTQILKRLLFPDLFPFYRLLEPVVVAGVALALLCTQKRGWAWVLIVYSSLFGVLLLLSLPFYYPKNMRPQFQFICAVINLTMLWLLVRWLRKQKPVAFTQNVSTDSDISHRT
jgi:hypothetical protein